MDIHFHYAAIKALASHAGFSRTECQTIAYASQYVDDATAYKPLALDKDPGVDGIRFEDKVFDPICTAHKDLDYMRSVFRRRAHLLVYVCFHFVPSLRGATDAPGFRRVSKNGSLARRLVREAVAGVKHASAKEERTMALIRLGIALHSFADTWSHQGFSGYRDNDNNDISNLQIRKRGGHWRDVDLVSELMSYAMPNIGHAETGELPDLCPVTWRCRPRKRTANNQKNAVAFLDAAKEILGLLSSATGEGDTWSAIKPKLSKCFNNVPLTKGFENGDMRIWRQEFPGLGFSYDEKEWFEKALRPQGGLLDLFGSVTGLDPADFDVLGGKEYFYFHAAAGKQRKDVCSAVKAASLVE